MKALIATSGALLLSLFVGALEPEEELRLGSARQEGLEQELERLKAEVSMLRDDLKVKAATIENLQQENMELAAKLTILEEEKTTEPKELRVSRPVQVPVYLGDNRRFAGAGTLYWRPVSSGQSPAWQPFVVLPESMKSTLTQVVTNVVEKPVQQVLTVNNMFPGHHHGFHHPGFFFFPTVPGVVDGRTVGGMAPVRGNFFQPQTDLPRFGLENRFRPGRLQIGN